MLKDWFYYTRGQRRTILLLLIVILLLVGVVIGGGFYNVSNGVTVETLDIADSLYAKVENDRREWKGGKTYAYNKNHNTSPSVRGYTYKKSAEASGYYGTKSRKDTSLLYPRQEKYTSKFIIDVNSADTLILKKVPGIGSVISRNIVNYRNRLGGFYDVRQLLEIRYVDSTLLDWFEVKSGLSRKINVNKAGMDELRNHPYMDYYKAKAIIDFRRKRGPLSGMSQISILGEFTEDDILRLSHYFEFE
ncbi:helix-hairpin-helix domain-containing protein [Bacteroides caecigallinarum]|uniref:ComEA family DNA-binding protein n=1 Tax=Bacteroides caecigallinarum TaxID=1411144 RepID=UPI0019579BDD|nr:helix-hairpin-helix domain-containing protein [Bacteroides caecigallinarum]MBM6889271.1 helix-hairpin-helix domain-containing protein [Bacteroides caecigallinarum]